MMTNPAIDAMGQNDIWNVFGEKIVCRVPGTETAGRFTVVEESSPPGGGAPPNYHNQTDEVIYVLEGRYEIQVGEEKFMAGKGDCIVVPRGTVHGFRNVSGSESRMLAIITPSGFENFFAEISSLETIDMAAAAEIGRRNDLELIA